MAHWLNKLNLTVAYRQYERDVKVPALCKAVAVQIEALIPKLNFALQRYRKVSEEEQEEFRTQLTDIKCRFEEAADQTIEEFDDALYLLYELGDLNVGEAVVFPGDKFLWVEVQDLPEEEAFGSNTIAETTQQEVIGAESKPECRGPQA